MIEIIKHGNYNRKHYITCPSCGCEFSYTQEDVIKSEASYSGSSLSSCIFCPDCGNRIDIFNSISDYVYIDKAQAIPAYPYNGTATTITNPVDNTAPGTATVGPSLEFSSLTIDGIESSTASSSADDIAAAKDAMVQKEDDQYAEKLMKEWRRKEHKIRKPLYDFDEELFDFDRIFDDWFKNLKNEKASEAATTTNEVNSDKDSYIAGTIIITDENGTKTYNWNNKTKDFELDKE